MKALHTDYCQQVASYSANLRAHLVEHVTKLLDIRFASCIIYSGGAFGEHRSHDDIGGTRHRSLVEKHIAACELFGKYLIYVRVIYLPELGTKILEPEEMGVEPAPAYLVASWLGNDCLAKAGKKRAYH